jgi:GMP synthase (glutamine-hydrolysing)
VLVVQHEERVPLGLLGGWWADAGLSLDVRRGDLGDAVPARVADTGERRGEAPADGVVVLGGTMGAHDEAAHPWLTTTRALLREAVRTQVPVLGVCLGHQLLAVALGGEVRRNPAGRTVGPVPFRPTAEAAHDPLVGGLGGDVLALHHNDDVVTRLPAGADRLATAPDGTVQAARFGPVAWGVQCHPEATPEVYAGWLAPDADAAERAGLAAARALEPDLRRWWRPVADRFAALVGEHAAYRPLWRPRHAEPAASPPAR